MQIEYNDEQHEKLVSHITKFSKRGGCVVKLGGIIWGGYVAIGVLLSLLGNMNIRVTGALKDFLLSPAGNVIARIITFVAWCLVGRVTVGSAVRYVTEPVKAASNKLIADIQGRNYTVDRTVCIEVHTTRNSSDTYDTFFVLEGRETIELEAPSELVAVGNTVDVITHGGESFVIKAL